MTTCHVQASAAIELYFYGELTGAQREAVELHLADCAECRHALEELSLIRTALASQPDVSSPPNGWSGFMVRLQDAVEAETAHQRIASLPRPGAATSRGRLAGALAMAALVTLVTVTVLVVMRDRAQAPGGQPTNVAEAPAASPAAAEVPSSDDALSQVSGQHFERSKLVVLGLATKDPADSASADWNYERSLAASLLDDTRIYRQAAEGRGMRSLAGVLKDLEIVLLQTSMSEEPDAEALAQLQRLIRRRDLISKMELANTTGLLP
jgi:hypothetical protein